MFAEDLFVGPTVDSRLVFTLVPVDLLSDRTAVAPRTVIPWSSGRPL